DNDLVVGDEAVADAGAEGEHGETVEASPASEPVFGFGESDDVVFDDGGNSGGGLQHGPERDVAPFEKWRARNGGVFCDEAADSDSESRHGGNALGEVAGEIA